MAQLLFTFPGQGPQYPGMLHELPDHECSQQTLDEAATALNEDPFSWHTEAALAATRAVQLCELVSGVTHARWLAAQGIKPDYCSGLSIGAFPAAVVAGALPFGDAIRLVALRGELMQGAYPSGYGLAAISGLPQKRIEQLVAEVHQPQSPVYLANINTEDQFVIAGQDEAMKQVLAAAHQLGASKTTRLAVSVPSHCALLDEPAQQLAAAMADITLSRPRHRYLSGSTGRVLWTPEAIADDLAFNMARTVHWHDAMVAAYQRGVRMALEMPPGAVLTGLTRSVMSDGETLALRDTALSTIKALVARNSERYD